MFTQLVYQRLIAQEAEGIGKLPATCERLIVRGIKPAQVLEALGCRRRESQLAQALQAVGIPE
jgi:hypothetical protein